MSIDCIPDRLVVMPYFPSHPENLKMKTRFVSSLVLCLALFSTLCFAQQPPVMPSPTKEHAWLTKFVGEWKTESKGTMGPDQPPMECNGTLVSRSLGSFWVLNEMKGEMAGDPMVGVQTIGYDEAKKKYVGTWVDSMTAYMWRYEGSVDKSGNTLTLQADGPNFMAEGKLTKFEDIYEFKSATEIRMTSRMLDTNGQWVTFMSGTATRTK
jgi:hypothetical protein